MCSGAPSMKMSDTGSAASKAAGAMSSDSSAMPCASGVNDVSLAALAKNNKSASFLDDFSGA